MFRLLPRISIAGQLTLLVAVVAGLAIYVVSRAAEQHGRDLLLSRGRGNLADECRLERVALRESVRSLSRTFRRGLGDLTRYSDDAEAQGRVLQKMVAQPTDPIEGDLSTVQEACLVTLSPEGELHNRAVFRLGAKGATKAEVSPDSPTNLAVAELWRHLRKGGKANLPETILSQFHRSGSVDAYRYLFAIACVGEPRPEGRTAVLVTLDFTQLVENHARRLPRHLLFVRNEAGYCLYHPDPKRVGTQNIPWDIKKDDEAFRPLEEKSIEELEYYTTRQEFEVSKTETLAACMRLEKDLGQWAALRFSPIREGDRSVVLSCADEKVLDEATRNVGIADSAGSRFRVIRCSKFIGHHLAHVPLDAGQNPAGSRAAGKAIDIDVILTAALEELTAQESKASSEFWLYRSLPALVISAVLALIAAYVLTRPLRRLKHAADQLARGNYAIDVSVVGPGEVGELANTFRDMTEQIRRRERDM